MLEHVSWSQAGGIVIILAVLVFVVVYVYRRRNQKF